MRDPSQLADNRDKVVDALVIIHRYLKEYWEARLNTNGLYTPNTLWSGPRWSPMAYSVMKEAYTEMRKIETYLFQLKKQTNFADSEKIFDFLSKQLVSSGYRIKGFRPSLSLKLDILFGTGRENLKHLREPKNHLTCEEPYGVYFYADFQPYVRLAIKQQEKSEIGVEAKGIKDIKGIKVIINDILLRVEKHDRKKANTKISELIAKLRLEPDVDNHELFEMLIAYLQAKISIIGGWIRDVRGSDTIIGFIPSVEEGLRFLLGALRHETRHFLRDNKDRYFGWNIGAVHGKASVLLGYWPPVEAVGKAAKFVEKAEEAKHVFGGRSTVLCPKLGRKAKHFFGDQVDMQEYASNGYFTTTSEI